MRPNKPAKLDKKRPEATRDALEDIRDSSGGARPVQNDIRYLNSNRDRALGENDRTGRHFDEVNESASDEGSAASEDHEAD